MTLSSAQLGKEEQPLWFCLKAQPKHEHVAAAALRNILGVESFSPRLRFRKSTKRGAVWFVEALFPGYIFARFNYRDLYRQVQYVPGVSSIVRFGDRVAAIDESTLAGLRKLSGDDEVIIFDPELRVGDAVQIVEGAFQGLEAVVTQLLPARDRVKVLLDFLGRQIEAEVQSPKVITSTGPRETHLGQ
ncbi:transcription termination/antitermination protein NusG [Verrucomicrobiota bacterium sgz303538]